MPRKVVKAVKGTAEFYRDYQVKAAQQKLKNKKKGKKKKKK